jgi:hypothetical protein
MFALRAAGSQPVVSAAQGPSSERLRAGVCAMVCAMVSLGVKPAKRAFGEFSPISVSFPFSARLRAKVPTERAPSVS